MSKSLLIELAGLGAIALEKSRRAKKLSISYKNPNLLRIAVPARISFGKAEELVRSNPEWVKEYFNKIKRIQEEQDALLSEGEESGLDDIGNRLILRVKELCRKHGFKHGRIRLKKQKTRWGSCSVKNNISLNIKLAKLPGHLVDYVILHELVHTEAKNHGKAFWRKMEDIIEHPRQLDQELKKYHIALMR